MSASCSKKVKIVYYSSSDEDDCLQSNEFWQEQDYQMDGSVVLPTCAITIEKIAEVEKELNFFEKVSLVYLLYDDLETTFQRLLQLQKGEQEAVLSEWAQSFSHTDNWQLKILEALAIIDNFYIINELGYDKTFVCQKCMPSHDNTSLFIDKIKKNFYRVCKTFTSRQAEQFLNIVRHDFEKKKLYFKEFDPKYLQYYFVYWMLIRYISPGDLTNLCEVFQAMDMCELADNVQTLEQHGVVERDYEYFADFERSLSSTSLDTMSTISSSTSTDTDLLMLDQSQKNRNFTNCYNVDYNYPGVCLIINQENFYAETNESTDYSLLPSRKGTNKDRDSLKEMFESLGFTVVIHNDCTGQEIMDNIRETVNMVSHHSSLVICILSHGTAGMVFGVNGSAIKIQEIQHVISTTNTTNLRNKPKIFILQACQGEKFHQVADDENWQTNELTTVNDRIENLHISGPSAAVPQVPDMLMFWASVPGYATIRNINEGTWFIQSLCDVVLQNSNTHHFDDLCTLVQQKVISKTLRTSIGNWMMVPLKASTLSKFFHLPPLVPRQNKCTDRSADFDIE